MEYKEKRKKKKIKKFFKDEQVKHTDPPKAIRDPNI